MQRVALWLAMLCIPLVLATGALLAVSSRAGGRALAGGLLIAGDPLIVPDATLGFARPTNARTDVRDRDGAFRYDVYTDARGLRVDAPGDETPDRVGILTIGGSFSAGHGFANERSYTERLGRHFRVPVANAAVSSFGTVGALRSLARFADLEPRVVVYGVIPDHLRRNLDPCAPSFHAPCLSVPHLAPAADGGWEIWGPEPAQSAVAFAFGERVRALRERPTWIGRVSLGLDELRYRALARTREPPRASEREQDRALGWALRRMARRAGRLDATLVVVAMPHMDAPHLGRFGERVARVAPSGVVVVDFAAAMRERPPEAGLRPLVLTREDHHPSAEGHAQIARVLADAIERSGALTAETGPHEDAAR